MDKFSPFLLFSQNPLRFSGGGLVHFKGGVGNMFYDDAKLSRVAIVEE